MTVPHDRAVPGSPGGPAVPGSPALPAVPELPGLPAVPGSPGLPAVPGSPTLPPLDENELIDGHSVTELDDYLSAGRTPYDPSIENSASCRLYLSALGRLKDRSWDALTREAEDQPDRDELWITGLLDTIKDEVRAGRDIPIGHPDPTIRLTVTEAAVHGLIRHAADTLDGLLLGRTELEGDITQAAAPVVVTVTIAAEYGRSLAELADQLRQRVREALELHTELTVTAVTVVVDDIYTAKEVRS